MPKQVKKNSTEVAETITATTTTSPSAAVAVEAKAPKAKASSKAEKKVAEPKPVEVKVEATASAAEETVAASTTACAAVEDVEAAIAAKSAEFSAKLNQLGSLIASLKTEYKSMERQWTKDLKAAQKASKKGKRKTGNRQPSGFVKPTKISDELAKFLEKPTGSEMARTDVTREINQYIRKHNLQDKDNGRKINPDAKLQSLLKLKKTDELTYFNLQRYMSPHFAKSVAAAAAAAAAVATA
jgi:chromatin remodeling complex protein RSC6